MPAPDSSPTPADIAPLTDVVLTCLPDTASVREVLFGDGGLLAAGTWRGHVRRPLHAGRRRRPGSSPTSSAARGIDALDAPISGGVRGATAGTLSIMVGGLGGGP